ncbi:hypothetical protein R4311_003595 [Salmonella enterica]|nr:hypothetical protein [Salmonella enterica]
MLTCKHCRKESNYLVPVQANIVRSPFDYAWVVDLILACPHCGQQLNLFPTVVDFEALEALDDDD